VALRTFRRRWISGAASNRCAARHWRGRARSGGSSGEHAMKIIERDVAGASSGEAYQARTRSGGGAQLQEEGQQVYPFADWEQGARAPRKTPRPDPFWCCSNAEAPACAPHPSSARSAPPASWRRRAARRGPRATARARFRRRLCFCANFFLLRGVHWVVSRRFMLLACAAACYQGLPQLSAVFLPLSASRGGVTAE
jgi:hypothetical protein